MDLLYYFVMGTFSLLILTYQDLKNNMVVNDRWNWIGLGLALSLLSHVPHNLGYMLAGLPILFLMRYVLIKADAVGEADINTFVWIFYGYFIINFTALIIFAGIFVLFYFLKISIMKLTKRKVMPLYPEILATWVITNCLYGWFL